MLTALAFWNSYKKEIIVFLITIITLGYIWFLKMELKSVETSFADYKVQVQKNNLEYFKKIKAKEDEFKDYKHAFDLATAKEKITLIDKVRTDVQIIRIHDNNSSLPPLEGNCSDQLKGRFNEKNAIITNI